MSISIADLGDIASIRYPDLDFSKESIPTDVVNLAIKAISSDATTPERLSLGCFTCFKLKHLSTWDKWQAGECKQLHQSECGSHFVRHTKTVVLISMTQLPNAFYFPRKQHGRVPRMKLVVED